MSGHPQNIDFDNEPLDEKDFDLDDIPTRRADPAQVTNLEDYGEPSPKQAPEPPTSHRRQANVPPRRGAPKEKKGAFRLLVALLLIILFAFGGFVFLIFQGYDVGAMISSMTGHRTDSVVQQTGNSELLPAVAQPVVPAPVSNQTGDQSSSLAQQMGDSKLPPAVEQPADQDLGSNQVADRSSSLTQQTSDSRLPRAVAQPTDRGFGYNQTGDQSSSVAQQMGNSRLPQAVEQPANQVLVANEATPVTGSSTQSDPTIASNSQVTLPSTSTDTYSSQADVTAQAEAMLSQSQETTTPLSSESSGLLVVREPSINTQEMLLGLTLIEERVGDNSDLLTTISEQSVATQKALSLLTTQLENTQAELAQLRQDQQRSDSATKTELKAIKSDSKELRNSLGGLWTRIYKRPFMSDWRVGAVSKAQDGSGKNKAVLVGPNKEMVIVVVGETFKGARIKSIDLKDKSIHTDKGTIQ